MRYIDVIDNKYHYIRRNYGNMIHINWSVQQLKDARDRDRDRARGDYEDDYEWYCSECDKRGTYACDHVY